MDITPSNFLTRFPQILNAYNKCSIVAVDGEFSGTKFDQDLAVETYRGILPEEQFKLLEDSWDKPGMEAPYQKLRWVVRRFALLQLGITFAWPAKGMSGTFSLSRLSSNGVELTYRKYRRKRLPDSKDGVLQLSCQPLGGWSDKQGQALENHPKGRIHEYQLRQVSGPFGV